MTHSGCISPAQFGAVGDGRHNDTAALQRAIDACARAGGGTVLVPAGTYRIGTLSLASHLRLVLDAGACLLGSELLTDYHEVDGCRVGLLYARDAEDITIEGPGTIDGNAPVFMGPVAEDEPDGPYPKLPRPGQMLLFSGCRQVTLRGIVLRNAPHWTTHFADSCGIKALGVSIINDMRVPNNDGLNCSCCRDVIIADCSVQAGDDAIVVTGFAKHVGFTGLTGAMGGSSNVVVNNCILRSRSAGIRVGAGEKDVTDCRFSNCIITDTNRGIVVWQRDGSTISNIHFANLTIRSRSVRGPRWWGNGEPFAVTSVPRTPESPVGHIRNIRFRDIDAEGDNAVILHGLPGHPVEDIELIDVRLCVHRRDNPWLPEPLVDLRPTCLDGGLHPHAGHALVCKHASNVHTDRLAIHQCGWEPDRAPIAVLATDVVRSNLADGIDIRQEVGFPEAPLGAR